MITKEQLIQKLRTADNLFEEMNVPREERVVYLNFEERKMFLEIRDIFPKLIISGMDEADRELKNERVRAKRRGEAPW